MGVFALGMALGFVAYGAYQQKLEVLVPVAIVLAILTWFGSATDILGLLREWYKDKKEEERRLENQPKLTITYEPRKIPDIYCPERTFTYPDYGTTNRKYLRIKVTNEGGGLAKQCEAILTITENNSDDLKNPTTEEKVLQWSIENNATEVDIRPQGNRILNVVFSEISVPEKYAFIGTTLSLNGPTFPRPIDAFSVGSFDFTMKIIGKEGGYCDAKFSAIVTNNWQEISMERTK